MTGIEYANAIASYVKTNFSDRGVKVFREVNVGTSIIGKRRKVDVFVLHEALERALAVECKFQSSQGTTDEKIPYALADLRAMQMLSCLVYAGSGFSAGVLHLLQASEEAAYCLPGEGFEQVGLLRGEPTDSGTWQFDHVLAQTFAWWDLLLEGKKPV